MKEKKKIPTFIKAIIVIFVLMGVVSIAGVFKKGGSASKASHESILALHLKGVLLDKHKFMKELRKYSQDEKIKGVLVRMDSPGGSVAVSQEIYQELKRIRQILKKPVVISAGSMMASGALYAAMSASSIVVNPGTLVGSIGVIFPLLNMERLFDWAKVEPYSIKTGEFKDAGSRFRPMTSKERVLFQDLVNELLDQFKAAILEGRKMNQESLELYTDGRVFTGETAVSAGFADSIGSYSNAVELIGEMSGLGKKPKLFTPQPNYLDLLSQRFSGALTQRVQLSPFMEEKNFIFSLLSFPARPLYIFPPAVGM